MKRKFLSIIFLFSLLIFLNSCGGKLPGGDARKNPPNPDERVRKNIEEGRGFRMMDNIGKTGSGNFEFSSSNELWRATLDIIDFMSRLTGEVINKRQLEKLVQAGCFDGIEKNSVNFNAEVFSELIPIAFIKVRASSMLLVISA